MKVDHHIKIPEGRKGKRVGVLRTLKVGDSVVDEATGQAWHGSARCCGIKITTRKIASGKVRIWRIK